MHHTNGLTLEQPVTFFVRENGTGKSTLLEAIAVAMGYNAEGGSRDFSFHTKDTHSILYEYLTIMKSVLPKDGFFLRAESFYHTASYLEENSNLERYGGISLHAQSYGESFFSLICNCFEGHGLYLLDEPEAALSPQKLPSLLVFMDGLINRQSQLIISTHSPILMVYPPAEIWQFSEKGIEKVHDEEVESIQITKQFLDNPKSMLRYLFAEE